MSTRSANLFCRLSVRHGVSAVHGGLRRPRGQERVLRALFWAVSGLGCPILLSIAALALVYGTVFKVQDFNTYVVYLGTGLVVWNGISAAIGSAPNLFESNHTHVHNTNLNPIFYVLEEWAFQLQTFLQSFGLVVIALSWFQHSLLVNLYCSTDGCHLLNLFLFLFWAPAIVCLLGARYRDFYQLGANRACSWYFCLSPILYRKDNLGAMAWTANLNPLYRVLSPVRHSLMARGGSVVCRFVVVRPQSPGFMGGAALVESRTPSPPFSDLNLFGARARKCYGGSML